MRNNKLIALLAGVTTLLMLISVAAYMLFAQFGVPAKVLALQPESSASHDDHDDHAGDGEHSGEDGHAGHDEHADDEEHASEDGHAGHDEHADDEEHASEDGHAGDDDHADDEEHAGEDSHDEHGDGMVHLSKAKMEDLDIVLGSVHSGTVQSTVSIPAEAMLDPDDKAHVVPWVSGIAREVLVSIGDQVKQGDLLAVIESRELGRAKSDYLADLSRQDLARATFEREKQLWEDKISAKQDYLEAQQDYRAAQIEVEAAKQALFALGVSPERVKALPGEKSGTITRYEIRAPFDGTLIERHITPGEAIDSESEIFVIANLNTVWVMGQLPERDLRRVSVGQEATLRFDAFPGEEVTAKVDYIGSVLDPRTRTLNVRAVLPNPDRHIRAGMFGRMLVFSASHEHTDTWLVPNEALQRTESGGIVYRQTGEGTFEPVPVDVLHASETLTEVKGPLREGDPIVVNNVFIMKSEAGKEAMGGGHSH